MDNFYYILDKHNKKRMNEINITITKEELKKLINDAVFQATSTQANLEYKLITENELSERINISKITLHKFRKQGKIPYSKVGRPTIFKI